MSNFKCRAFLKTDGERRFYRTYGKWEPITNQVRFVIRMAQACAERGTPYAMVWNLKDETPHVAFSACDTKPLPSPTKRRPEPPATMRPAWNPRATDASYTLNAYRFDNSGNLRAGYVLQAGNGLALAKPGTSESGEIELTDGDKLSLNWYLIHAESGLSFGLQPLPFARAVKALNFAAGLAKWDVSRDAMGDSHRAAYEAVQTEYGNADVRDRLGDRQRARELQETYQDAA